MARFERGSERWRIERVGKTLEIFDGDAKKPTVKRFVSEAAADQQLARLVSEKLAAGFVQLAEVPRVEKPRPKIPEQEPRNAELERAIVEDPDNAGAYSVYGDWLHEQGDPRAELIAAQITEATDRDANVRATIQKLLRTHAPRWLGKLRDECGKALSRYYHRPFLWRYGFIHRAELQHYQVPVDEALELLLANTGRFLGELSLYSREIDELARALARLERGPLRTLRVLELDGNFDLGDRSALWRALPQLRRLTISNTSGLSPELVQSVAHAPWPNLERLDLRFGRSTAQGDDIRPLLARHDLRSLTHLKFRAMWFISTIVPDLVASPFAHQLQVLDVRNSRLSEADARLLLANKDRFPALREIWIAPMLYDPRARHLLQTMVKRVVERAEESTASFPVHRGERYERSWE